MSFFQVDNRMVAQLLESILFIIDAVLPMLGKLPPIIVGELEQDLKQMIVRHSFLSVVYACIKYIYSFLPLFSSVIFTCFLPYSVIDQLIDLCDVEFSIFS